jgi:glutamate/tyrosine decarboxylase-like PLP-dependent enzyme
MIPEKLELIIKECLDAGEHPFFVACTAGTTVLGAYDPIDLVSKICKKYKLWLHVDVCFFFINLIYKKY